jgi:hypothetical protein
MRSETYYVVKKNKYYGGEILQVGLDTHCHYADMLLYAKKYETEDAAKRAIEIHEQKNSWVNNYKGKWKIQKIEIREV